MREICFRGKRTYDGRWCYGVPVNCDGGDVILVGDLDKYQTVYELYQVTEDVIPETVGQYTGLTDNNGTKIFEGDIVRFAKNIYQIIFTVGSFALYDKHGEMISKIGGHNDHCYSFMDLYVECCWEDNYAFDIEILGNIHDNPELLE